jgi:hypothetical protein
VNGIAPALIAETKMLPGSPEELAKSTYLNLDVDEIAEGTC